MYTKDKKLDSSCSIEELAKRFKGFACAKIESVLNKAALFSEQKNADITKEDIENAING